MTEKESQPERVLVACFGSLKKGFYNHPGLGEDAEFKGNTTVHGVMYTGGSYPHLYHPVEDKESPFREELARDHDVEVYEINARNAARIDGMELGAGYEREYIDTEWGQARIYFNPHDVFSPRLRHLEAYTHETMSRV